MPTVLAVIILSAGTASAQGAADAPVTPDVPATDPEKAQDDYEDEDDYDEEDDSNNLAINMFFSTEFEKKLAGDGPASFDMDVVELLVQYQVDKFRFSTAIDFEHGVDTEEVRGAVQLAWSYIEYSLHKNVNIRAGKFLNPFGLYNGIHNAKGLFLSVKEPLSIIKPGKLSGNGFRYAPRWDVGIAAVGSFIVGDGSLSYNVTVANGDTSQSNPFEEDNNNDKSFGGKVVYSTGTGFSVGLSGYADWLKEDEGDGTIQSMGAYAKYTSDTLKLFVEGAYGRLEAPGLDDLATETGFVAEVGYTLQEKYTPYAQAQRLDTSFMGSSDNAMLAIAGINTNFQNGLFFKVEYNYGVGSDNNEVFMEFPASDFHEIKAAFVGGF